MPISPSALIIHEQKQWGPTSPQSARPQYRIYADEVVVSPQLGNHNGNASALQASRRSDDNPCSPTCGSRMGVGLTADGCARSAPSATRSSYRSDIISSILSSGCNDKKPGSRGMIWRTPNAVGKLTRRTPKVDRTTYFASPRVPRSSRATIKSASQAAPSCNDGPFGSELTTKMPSTGSCDKNGLNSMAEQLRKPPNVAGRHRRLARRQLLLSSHGDGLSFLGFASA